MRRKRAPVSRAEVRIVGGLIAAMLLYGPARGAQDGPSVGVDVRIVVDRSDPGSETVQAKVTNRSAEPVSVKRSAVEIFARRTAPAPQPTAFRLDDDSCPSIASGFGSVTVTSADGATATATPIPPPPEEPRFVPNTVELSPGSSALVGVPKLFDQVCNRYRPRARYDVYAVVDWAPLHGLVPIRTTSAVVRVTAPE